MAEAAVREVRHILDDLIGHPGWEYYLRNIVAPVLARCRRSLLTNDSLDDRQRAAYIAMLRETKSMMVSLYELANARLPKELTDLLE